MTSVFTAVTAATVGVGYADAEGAANPAVDKPPALIATLSPAPKVRTADGAYELKLAGFFQVDIAESVEDSEVEADGAAIRRARFGVRGVAAQHWRYDFMLEAGGGLTELFDASIAYTSAESLAVKVGQFKEPFGLEWSTGAPWWTFADRALTASITPKRAIGAMAATGGADWGLKVAGFADNADLAKAQEEDSAVTARVHWAPMATKHQTFHVGAAVSHRAPDPVAQSVRFKAKHETAGALKPVVDTGPISNVDHTTMLNGEVLGMWGPFSLQAEYAWTQVARFAGADPAFSAAYAQASWFVTGERRPYNAKRGAFGRVKPSATVSAHDGQGAVELAVRFDHADLSDGDVAGGVVDRMTLGVNWYPNTNVRLTANYVYARTDRDARLPNGTPQALIARAQFAF